MDTHDHETTSFAHAFARNSPLLRSARAEARRLGIRTAREPDDALGEAGVSHVRFTGPSVKIRQLREALGL